jgi:hypothetical protein
MFNVMQNMTVINEFKQFREIIENTVEVGLWLLTAAECLFQNMGLIAASFRTLRQFC